ncbi:response regulator transcription factor [Polaromonas sp.]|uniref:response regulator transcription factor n=1 Tax=Polaromonas sp. TaxID=1869339 RepID=UPI003BAAF92F
MQQIAVIDDDPEVIGLLTKWLDDIIPDCKVHPFSQLEKALLGIANTDFDLVVSDVDLGSGSDKYGGVKIAKALDTRRTPLLVISGFTVQEGVFRALDAWDYLQKPIDEADFKTEVKRALVYRKGLTNTAERTSESGFLLVPDLIINRRSRETVQWKGHRLQLSMSKIDIVEALAKRAGTPVNHKDLFEFIASGKNISNLRVKMSEIRDEFRSVDAGFDRIHPVPMNGYLWRID